jgi:hypothetical protein
MKIKNRQAPKLLTLAVNDRIMMLFAAEHLSAYGTERTFRPTLSMSAFGGKADMARTYCYVRF